MKLGIMQPYFFPYIGYWQLMNAVDTYVVYDDVTFIKNGWINRNRILINGEPHYINLPTVGVSSYKLIKDISLNPERKFFSKLLKSIEEAYKKAPYFRYVFPVLEDIIMFDTNSMTDLLFYQIKKISDFLNMSTNIILSSNDVPKDLSLHSQDKVINICKNLNASIYYNAIGGKDLYNKDAFLYSGINLSFLNTKQIKYKQYSNDFIPNLSIIDMMMFCSQQECINFLMQYDIE